MRIIQSRRDFPRQPVSGRRCGRPGHPGIVRRRSPARDHHDPARQDPWHLHRASVRRRRCCAPKASPMSATSQRRRAVTGEDGTRRAGFQPELAAPLVLSIDAGDPVTVVSGVHSGCFELFANERVRSVLDLKGKSVGVQTDPFRTSSWRSRTCRARSRQRCHQLGDKSVGQAEGTVRRRQDRRFSGFPPSPRAARPQHRSRDSTARSTGHGRHAVPCRAAGALSMSIRSRPSA